MKRLVVAASAGLEGTVRVPGDKSVSHRVVLLGAMARGETVGRGWLVAEDCLRTLAAVEALGCEVTREGSTVRIRSEGYEAWLAPDGWIDLGNSGTGFRLLLGALAGRPFAATLDGDASLRRRPMDRVAEPLGRMGARVEGKGERCLPPVTVRGGRLRGIEYDMPVASAQVKSALLLAGLQAEGRTAVCEPAPCRDHTERMLGAFGVEVEADGPWSWVEGPVQPAATEVRVPGDISSGAYLLAAGLLAPRSRVTVEEVGLNPTRTGLLEVLEAMGARLEVSGEAIHRGEPVGEVTVWTSSLRGTRVDGALVPRAIDELPLVAVLATQAEGETVVEDARELRVKESDRVAAMARGLAAMGADIEEREDGWVIRGPSPLRGARVSADLDHRVAMSLAVAGLIAQGETIIEGAETVATSFPGFVDALAELKAMVRSE